MLKLWIATCEDDFASEFDEIEEMFRRGLTRLILKKRRNRPEDYERWLLGLSMEYRERIWVWGTPDISNQLDVRGCVVHEESLKQNVPESYKRVNCMALCKDADDYRSLPEWVAFALVGPFYQPLSALEPRKLVAMESFLEPNHLSIPLVAWGGVEPENLHELKKMPLSGVSVLGGVWNYADPINAFIKLQRACIL